MARGPDERVNQAFELYKSGMKLVEIASQLNIPPGTVRRWKSTYKWDNERSDKINECSHKKGAPKGNKNGHGAPKGNKHAEKYGFFSKYLPDDALNIFNGVENISHIDLLWHQIKISYTNLIRAQLLTKNPLVLDDKFFSGQSRALIAFNNMIKQYDELMKSDLATEEQKERINKLRAEVKKITGEDTEIEDLTETDADIYGQ